MWLKLLLMMKPQSGVYNEREAVFSNKQRRRWFIRRDDHLFESEWFLGSWRGEELSGRKACEMNNGNKKREYFLRHSLRSGEIYVSELVI